VGHLQLQRTRTLNVNVDHNAIGCELNFGRLNLESKGKNAGSFALEFYFGCPYQIAHRKQFFPLL
jgi:hypothetical protein